MWAQGLPAIAQVPFPPGLHSLVATLPSTGGLNAPCLPGGAGRHSTRKVTKR